MGFNLDNIEKTISQNKDVQKTALLKREITLFKKPFSNKVKEDFYVELSLLLKAGINLKNSLELIAKSQKKAKNKSLIYSLVENIIEGKSLSIAIKDVSYFTSYEYYSIKIGEETGTLAKVAEQLGDFYYKKNEQRRNLISALTYPVIIFSTAVLVMVFMLNFVVPMFQDIFRQQNIELPAITKFIVKLSGFIKSYGVILFLISCFLFLSYFFLEKKTWYNKIKDSIILRLPFVGQFVKALYLAQFTQAIALLMASKVPMADSINLVVQMINFHPLKDALKEVNLSILKGNSLTKSLKSNEFFDEKMVALVEVAEETNKNEFVFERLNIQYNTKVQQYSKLLSTVMEPIIILFVGVIVGLILVAMYLPMFKLSNIIG